MATNRTTTPHPTKPAAKRAVKSHTEIVEIGSAYYEYMNTKAVFRVTVRDGKIFTSIPGSGSMGRHPTMKAVTVLLDPAVLKAVTEKTGLQNDQDIIKYAVNLLADADPSAEFAKQNAGALEGLELDL